MNTNDESFLKSLLQYHTHLVDQQFVDKIISKLEVSNKRRYHIMIMTILLACLIVVPIIFDIVEDFELLIKLPQLSLYLLTFVLLSIVGLTAWLTSEDF